MEVMLNRLSPSCHENISFHFYFSFLVQKTKPDTQLLKNGKRAKFVALKRTFTFCTESTIFFLRFCFVNLCANN